MKEKLESGEIDINSDLNPRQKYDIEKLLLEFSGIFAFDSKNIGICNLIEHTIDTGDNKPISQNPYRYSFAQRKFINEQIDEWLQMGIITPIASEWSSPVVLVRKKTIDPKTGTFEQRLCIDMRRLNMITVSDLYPLPRVQDALDSLAGAKYFTSLDLNSGYLQIRVKDSDIKKTTFCTQDGVCVYSHVLWS
jgi:hypothetical protein